MGKLAKGYFEKTLGNLSCYKTFHLEFFNGFSLKFTQNTVRFLTKPLGWILKENATLSGSLEKGDHTEGIISIIDSWSAITERQENHLKRAPSVRKVFREHYLH